jgi:hypothetical protein
MDILGSKADERVKTVHFNADLLIVELMDGRAISVPLVWYPKLLNASIKDRSNWEICGGGYGIHWPDIDEDLHTEGLLRGAPAPNPTRRKIRKHPREKISLRKSRTLSRYKSRTK